MEEIMEVFFKQIGILCYIPSLLFFFIAYFPSQSFFLILA